MDRSDNKRVLDSDDQCGDEWDTPEKLTIPNKSKKMRHVTTQPLSEQGWGRCQSGFDGVGLETEKRQSGLWSHQRGRGPKRISLGSEAIGNGKDSPLDIDWSSSSDDLSDIEPLPLQNMPRRNSENFLQRKKTTKRSSISSLKGSRMKLMRCEASLDDPDVEIAEEEDEENEAAGGSWMRKPSSLSKETLASSSDGQKSTQIDISDYDSLSEDQATMTARTQQASSSAHILDQSPTPQPALGESPAKESPRTGTELLKKLKLPSRTPDKEVTTGGPSGSGDSAKKKRKFIRGGLAEGLQRVINREKSATVFRVHRTADATTPQSLALDLHVLSVEEVRGLFVTRCQMCSLNSEVAEEMFVLFTQANGRQLKLGVGSRVRVHPPWQKLTLPNYKELVLLCTYFCDSADDMDEKIPDVATNRSLYPDKPAGASEMQLKPIQLFQPLSYTTKTPATESTLQSILPRRRETPSSHVSDSFLDSIAQSGAYSAAGMCVRARIIRVFCRGRNAESTSIDRKHQGAGKLGKEPAAMATQWVLLLRDDHGVFCELHVRIGDEEGECRRRLVRGEGRTMVFTGLKVMRRVNRTRSPGLFSLIDSLWSPCEGAVSQSETESQNFGSQGLVSPQSFCYILGVQTLRNSIREEVSDGVRIPCMEPVIHTLREVQQISEMSNQRVTVYAKVIHAHSETGAGDEPPSPWQPHSNSAWHLFLTDHSLDEESAAERNNESGNVTGMGGRDGCTSMAGCSGGSQGARLVHVHVRPSCKLMECVEESFAVPGSLMLLRDLCVDHSCSLYADTYTTIQKLTNEDKCSDVETLGTFTPKDDIISRLSHVAIPPIPTLGHLSDENTLVSVTGVVMTVDEQTAYSWPACDTCGNNRLEAGPNSGSQLHCGTCQRSVTSPLTRMHLELFLNCPSLEDKETGVKVQLLQSSIEQVLPPLSSQEEGYDLQCIMGVNIGPIICFLKTVARQPGEPVFFDLEEVPLCAGT